MWAMVKINSLLGTLRRINKVLEGPFYAALLFVLLLYLIRNPSGAFPQVRARA
jgi:hypothetical protein